MAVNGGGGVTLQFQRSPLKAITRTTFLPWNQIVIINPVIMTPVGAGISWNEEDTSLKVKQCRHSFFKINITPKIDFLRETVFKVDFKKTIIYFR